MSGYVYAISDGEGRVKIGWSEDPVRRLNKINSDCPGQVSLLGAIEATKEQEAEAHELLARWNVGGEWFRLEGAVVDFVEMLPQLGPRRPSQWTTKPHNGHPVQVYRRKHALSLRDLGERVGVTYATLSRIESGKLQVTEALLFRFAHEGISAAELRPDLAELFNAKGAA